MKFRTIWRKLASYTPFTIVLESLVGLLIFLFWINFQVHDVRWAAAIILSLAFGVIATITGKTWAEKYRESLGLSSAEQVWALSDAVRTGILPEDKVIQGALPPYLARRATLSQRSLGKSMTFYFRLFGFMFLLSILLLHDWLFAVYFGLFLAFGAYSQNSAQKTQRNITALQELLNMREIKSDSEADKKHWGYPNPKTRSAIRNGLVIGFVAVTGISILSAALTKKYNTASTDIAGSSAILKALETQYPQDKIGVSSRKNYNSGGQKQGRRMLIVGIAGKSFLTSNQLSSAANDICFALAANAQKYNDIYLQTTVEHTFLSLSFDSYGRSNRLNCQTIEAYDSQVHRFASVKYDFQVDFPGTPQTYSSAYLPSSSIGPAPLPYATYSSLIDNKSESFTLEAFEWPKSDADFAAMPPSSVEISLISDIKRYVSTTDGTVVHIQENPLTNWQDGTIEEAEFTQPAKGFTATGYVRAYIYGNTEYLISSTDSGEAEFEWFADSFTWTGNKTSNPDESIPHRLAPFTSSRYNFKINLPDRPTVSNYLSGSYAIPGKPSLGGGIIPGQDDNVPNSLYSATSSGGTEVFNIYSYSWPKQDNNFAYTSEPKLNATLISYTNEDLHKNGDKLVSMHEMHILGGKTLAEEAQFTVPGNAAIYGYDRVFTVGNFEYDLYVEGTYKTDFDTFANSFQFTGQPVAIGSQFNYGLLAILTVFVWGIMLIEIFANPILLGRLFRCLSRAYPEYYEIVGRPTTMRVIALPTPTSVRRRIKGIRFALRLTLKGTPSDFPKDVKLRRSARTVRYNSVMLLIAIIASVALLIYFSQHLNTPT